MVLSILLVSLVAAATAWYFYRRFNDVDMCCRTGRVDRLADLLRRRPHLIRSTDSSGDTPLHQAAKHGEVEVLRMLLEHGASINAPGFDGASPLHYAAAYGELAAVSLLVDRGADVDIAENHGITPMMVASIRGHSRVVDRLRDAGAHEFPPIDLDEDDPLLAAARLRARESCELLRELFALRPHKTMVKLPIATDHGRRELIWCDVLALDGEALQVRVRTYPVTQKGHLPIEMERLLPEIEDWTVELENGSIRGGFSSAVLLYRYQERYGESPVLAHQQARFVDAEIVTDQSSSSSNDVG